MDTTTSAGTIAHGRITWTVAPTERERDICPNSFATAMAGGCPDDHHRPTVVPNRADRRRTRKGRATR